MEPVEVKAIEIQKRLENTIGIRNSWGSSDTIEGCNYKIITSVVL